MGQQSTRSLLMLVLAPQFVYLALGMTFLAIGIASLLLPRPSVTKAVCSTPTPMLNPSHPGPLIRNQRDQGLKSPAELQRYKKRLVMRVGAFVNLYALLIICLTLCNFYEWWGRDSWLKAPEPSSAPRTPSKPILQVTNNLK